MSFKELSERKNNKVILFLVRAGTQQFVDLFFEKLRDSFYLSIVKFDIKTIQ